MLRKRLCFLLILGLMGLSGCIDDSTVISVDKTGAGTVVVTTYLSKSAQVLMEQMLGSMGGKTTTSAKKNPFLENVELYKAKAASMGEGVKFVSAKELKKADGSAGAQITYAYSDINKLKIDSEPNVPSGGGNDAMTTPDKDSSKKKESPVAFAFVKGTPSKLTVNIPKEVKSPGTGQPEEKNKPATPPTPEQLAQMKQMFNGFRMQLIVKVDGEITSSNAAYVEKDGKTNKKQIVTLIDMDMGKIIKDDATFKKIAAMGQIEDMATAKEKLKDIPGLKIETAEKVDIEFK
ncbi:MAG: hypothetical protein HQK55_17955 [Deltaproteobacteria bacterium]|nr:hypothetical protein [Deltaproteobacteria bacterium]